MARIYDFDAFRAAKQFESVASVADDVKSDMELHQLHLTHLAERIQDMQDMVDTFGSEVTRHNTRLQSTLRRSRQCLEICETGSAEDMEALRNQVQRKRMS